MTSRHLPIELTRRELLSSASLLAALTVMDANAQGQPGRKQEILTPEQQAALEKSNEALINGFVRDYATRDVNVLAAYMHDDIVYQISEGQPDIVGVEAYKAHHREMFAGLEKVDWRVLRSFTIGQLVINDRIDDFFPKPGSRVPRMQFRVAGYFLVQDGKIRVWRDFGYPGAQQLIERAPEA